MDKWTPFILKRLGGCLASGFGNGMGWFLGFYLCYKFTNEDLLSIIDRLFNVVEAILR